MGAGRGRLLKEKRARSRETKMKGIMKGLVVYLRGSSSRIG